MKNVLTGLGALAIAVVVPASALAATYQYVSVNGVLKTEEAATAAQALLVSDIAPHSGVIMADGSAGVDEDNGTVVGTGSTSTNTTSSPARSTVIMNADGSVTVTVPAGTHVHSDSDSDTGTSSNNGSCSQMITTSNDTTITSETTATGSTVHIEHNTPDTNC